MESRSIIIEDLVVVKEQTGTAKSQLTCVVEFEASEPHQVMLVLSLNELISTTPDNVVSEML